MPKPLPVIDGEENGDVYGYATSKRGAIRVGRRDFADGCVDAYITPGPVTLRDGTQIGDAWIALTAYGAGHT